MQGMTRSALGKKRECGGRRWISERTGQKLVQSDAIVSGDRGRERLLPGQATYSTER